jgi:hypothetical protein
MKLNFSTTMQIVCRTWCILYLMAERTYVSHICCFEILISLGKKLGSIYSHEISSESRFTICWSGSF